MKKLLILFTIFFSINTYAIDDLEIQFDQDSFEKAEEIKPDASFDEIVLLVKNQYKEDFKRLSMICGWFYYNFDYDIKKFETGGNSEDYRIVFDKKKGICNDICILFSEFCNKIEIRNEIIEGYTKGFGDSLNLKETNHVWNIVFVNNKWFHCDVLWTIGVLDGTPIKNNLVFKKRLIYWNFLNRCDDTFLKDHIPAIPLWQLRRIIIPLDDLINDTYNSSDNLKIVNVNDELDKLYNLDEITRSLKIANEAHKYNPNNYNILTVNYYNAGVEEFNTGVNSKNFNQIKLAEKYFTKAKQSIAYSDGDVKKLENSINLGLKKVKAYAP